MRLATCVTLLLVISHVSYGQEIPEWAEKVNFAIYALYVDHIDSSLPPVERYIPENMMPEVIIDRSGRLLIDVVVTIKSEAALPGIERLGFEPGTVWSNNRLSMRIPLEMIPELATSHGVVRISHTVFRAEPQGRNFDGLSRLDDSTHYINADEAKRVFGFKGKDVVVGIIDTGWISAT